MAAGDKICPELHEQDPRRRANRERTRTEKDRRVDRHVATYSESDDSKKTGEGNKVL